MTCKWCLRDLPLVDAHIIPRSLCLKVIKVGGHAHVLPADPSVPTGKTRSGEYDSEILCEGCERKFSRIDSYGVEFFGNRDWETATPLPQAPNDALLVRDVDYSLLKLFVYGVLLRAHWSQRPFFRNFSLGPCALELMAAIESGDAGPSNWHGIHVIKFVAPKDYPDPAQCWLAPMNGKIGGYNYATLSLMSFKVLVFTDSRPMPQAFHGVALDLVLASPDKPLVVLKEDFTKSSEFSRFAQAIVSRLGPGTRGNRSL